MVFPVQDITRENRLRLLMIFAAIHPDKFEGDKGTKLMQVAIYIFFLFCYFFEMLQYLLSFKLNVVCIYAHLSFCGVYRIHTFEP